MTSFGGTFGHTDDDVELWRKRDSVEFWIWAKAKKSIWVPKDRLFQLGMKTYPEVVDLTEMSESASQVLEQLLIGNRRYSASISMNQAAEICHVASELKFVNLLKLVERDLMNQTSESMEHAVDALSLAIRYEMSDAVGKLVDEIVFGFELNEQFLIYSKNQAAVEMVLNRKAELEGYGRQEVQPYLETFEDVGGVQIRNPGQDPNNQIALIPRNAQMHKVFLNAAKEKFRTLLNRPINSVKNGIAWVSAQNQRRRGGIHRNPNPEFQNF